jgi:thiol:disulfide interchange protein
MSTDKDIIVQFDDKNHFMNCLKENPGVIILQFTATWCKPCKEIKSYIESKFANCPNQIICCQLDVDENTDLYAFMKKNKQVNGIPALIAYFKGNISPYANASISGTNINSIDLFFNKCISFVRN